jgi:hypothetical protein
VDVNKILDDIKNKLKLENDLELAKTLGITSKTLKSYRLKDTLTDLQVSQLVIKTLKVNEENKYDYAIQPIVEFYPINKTKSLRGRDLKIISSDRDKFPHEYELKCKLDKSYSSGLYSFYNSQGRIIYVGKTKDNLWKEINHAFNRFREPQKIYSVDHTKKKKPIKERCVYLHEVAHYFSVYETEYSLTDKLEALIIRTIPNDITNTRIEPLIDYWKI